MPVVHVLNGPNLNLLGTRQPEVYGHDTLADLHARCEATAGRLGLQLAFHQTNHEGVLVDLIQAARGVAGGIVINPAAYSHTSVAVLDALMAFDGPVIEVHLSNIHRRESFRHHSHVSARAEGIIAGCGVQGYEFALMRLATLLGND